MARQWMLPEGGLVQETSTLQWMLPEGGLVQETTAAAAQTRPDGTGLQYGMLYGMFRHINRVA